MNKSQTYQAGLLVAGTSALILSGFVISRCLSSSIRSTDIQSTRNTVNRNHENFKQKFRRARLRNYKKTGAVGISRFAKSKQQYILAHAKSDFSICQSHMISEQALGGLLEGSSYH